jgi:hypothetical protein
MTMTDDEVFAKSPPKRFKDLSEYSPEEHSQRQQADRRGEAAPKFETPEYKQARQEALEKAGLADGSDD